MAVQKVRKKYFELQFIVWSVFGVGAFSLFLFILASVTEHWVFLRPSVPVMLKSKTKYLIEWRRSLWRDCILEFDNSSLSFDSQKTWRCFGRNFFPSDQIIEADDETDHGILNYSRSVAAFSILTCVLSLLPLFFTWYSIKEPRYMFKRLAGGLYFITAGSGIVCIEVFKHFLEYGKRYLPKSIMKVVTIVHGFSYYLACISIGMFCLAGVIIFIVSGKKKRSKARSVKEAVENEPVIIGRL